MDTDRRGGGAPVWASEAPRVDCPRAWTDALASVEDGAARFCLWEHATQPLAPVLFDALARGVPLAFACGPEGGIADDEVEVATARGWRTASLGPLVLRTETVAAAVLGAVRVWSGLYAFLEPDASAHEHGQRGGTRRHQPARVAAEERLPEVVHHQHARLNREARAAVDEERVVPHLRDERRPEKHVRADLESPAREDLVPELATDERRVVDWLLIDVPAKYWSAPPA